MIVRAHTAEPSPNSIKNRCLPIKICALAQQGTWRLEQTKSGHARVVYLNAVALAVLHEQRQVSRWDWVFPRLGGAVDAHLGDPKKAFQRVLRDAGITGIVLHSLRHSYATLLARDFPLQVAAQCDRWSGTASIRW
jgi:integrase